MNSQAPKGFTLIELLVVIAIIGLLSSVILASLNTARAKGRDAQRKAEMLQVQQALELYASDHSGAYPVSTGWNGYGVGNCGGTAGTLTGASGYIPNLAPTYIGVLPVDPNFVAQSCAGYIYNSDGTNYKFLDHVLPESYPTAGGLYDPVRPTWAYKVCSGEPACSTW